MSYIGASPIVGNFQVCDAISVVNGQAAYTMQVGSANVFPESANHMLVSLNGILQKPNGSFTISGSTITFSSNLVTGDVIDFIQLLGDVLDIGTPSDATVTNAKTSFVSTSSAAGLQIKGDGTTDGTLQLNCSQNSHGIKLKSPSHGSAQSYTLTFPTTAPSSGKALVTDGSGNLSFSSAGGLNLISTTTTSSAVSAIDITGIDSTYKVYKILIMKLHMANDDVSLNGRAIIAGSVETGANHPYVAHRVSAQGTPQHTVVASTDATSWKFTNGGIGNAANESCSGEITIFNPSQTSQFTTLAISMHYQDPSQLAGWSGGTAHYNEEPLGALTGIRLLASSGNIESAIIKLYGLS